MSWSSANQRMVVKLQAIERARKSVAEDLLSSARAASDHAEQAASIAREQLDRAQAMWAERLDGNVFDPALQLGLARQVVTRQSELISSDEQRKKAEATLCRRRGAWQQLEASARSGDLFLRRGRRSLARRLEDKRDHEIADLTSWKWFSR